MRSRIGPNRLLNFGNRKSGNDDVGRGVDGGVGRACDVVGIGGFATARIALGCGKARRSRRTANRYPTLKPAERGRGVRVLTRADRSGIVTPLIITPIALQWGWRAAFVFTGFIGAGWSG